MRVSSLIILLAVVGVVGFIAIFKRDWFFSNVDKGRQYAAGFTPAKTPAEALDRFREAIQKREYKFASTYCTGPYAELLAKSHDGAAAVGHSIDHIRNYMKDKGLQTDKSVLLLHYLDPFPANFTIKGTPSQTGDKATAAYVWEVVPLKNPATDVRSMMRDLDPVLFQNVLMPYTLARGFDVVKEGEHWKLSVPVPQGMPVAVAHFNDKWKTYRTTLSNFGTYMTNGRYDAPESFQNELIEALQKANPKS